MPTAVLAHDLSLTTSRGPVFDGVSLRAVPGDLIAVTGPDESGRTTLLLTLCGRFEAVAGTLVVAGYPIRKGLLGLLSRRHVLARTSLAGVEKVTDLDEVLTVGEHVGERAAMLTAPLRGVPLVDQAYVERMWGRDPVDGSDPAWGRAPGLDTPVWRLSRGQRLVLQIRLALMSPLAVLGVDEVDAVTDPGQRAAVCASLRAACEAGVCVVATSRGPEALVGLHPNHVVRLQASAR